MFTIYQAIVWMYCKCLIMLESNGPQFSSIILFLTNLTSKEILAFSELNIL